MIGGGFAGFAAAVALQENRHQVTLLERRGILGGRATSYPDAVSGEELDCTPPEDNTVVMAVAFLRDGRRVLANTLCGTREPESLYHLWQQLP